MNIPTKKEKMKIANKKWYYSKGRKYHSKYYAEHRDEILARNKLPANCRKHKETNAGIRLEVIAHYGGRCKCCGEMRSYFLGLDHINGGGHMHKREIKHQWIYRWAQVNNYPDFLQVLCYNCNMAKGMYGRCPCQDKENNPMYGKDLKVGMKVRPVIKTIDGPLSNSSEWAIAQEKKQDFLYVIKIADKVITCSANKVAKVGDKFSTIDLRGMDWKGWDCRTDPKFQHTTMAEIKKNAVKKVAAEPVKKVAKKELNAVGQAHAKKTAAKKAVAKKPAKKVVEHTVAPSVPFMGEAN